MRKLYKVVFLFFITYNITAQKTGGIRGFVSDKAGKKLTEANLRILNTTLGTSTNSKGFFEIKNIPVGNHTIKVSFLGYKTAYKKIKISTNTTQFIKFNLKEKKESLEEIIVTAKSEARKIREEAMPVSVISMKQLQGIVSDVKDVLTKTVGVTIRSTGGVGSASRISLRGLEGKRIGFFIDGTPMNNYSDFVDVNDVPVEMIDRIEIYKGIVPAKFGGSAMGGAVNIVIKPYPPKYIDANYTIGSFNTHKASLVLKMNPEDRKYEFGAGGFYTHSDNSYEMQSPFDDNQTIKRDHDQFKKKVIAGSFKTNSWWFDKIEIEPIFIYTYKQIQGIEHNIQHAHSKSKAYALVNNIEKENFLLEGLDLHFNLVYGFTEFDFIDTAKFRTNWDGTRYEPVSELGGEIGMWASNSKKPKDNFINKVNLNYLIDKQNSVNLNSVLNLASANPKDPIKDKVVGYKTNYKSNMKSWVLGFNYDYKSKDDKFLNSFTTKYYFYGMKTKIAKFGASKIENVNMKKSDFGISNALRYRFTPNFLGKLSLAYDVRLPSENELLGDGYTTAPSGNLIPERNTSFNFGVLYDLTGKHSSNLQIELNSYFMHLKNMIRYTGGYLQSQYQNFGEMHTIGTEIDIKANLTNWLYGYTNVTYQDLRDVRQYEANSSIPNPTKGSRMPNIPYFMANAGLEFHQQNLLGGKKQNTRIYVDGSFVDEYLYDFEQSIYQERRIPRSLYFNAGFEQSFKNRKYSIMFRINNLTNTRMLSELNRPLPGRNFLLRFRYLLK